MGNVASYGSAIYKDTELFMMHSIANGSHYRLHGCVLDFMYLLAMVVAETPEISKERCLQTFSLIVNVDKVNQW